MDSILGYMLLMAAVYFISKALTHSNRNDRTFLYSRRADNLESFPVRVRMYLDVHKKGLTDYLKNEWDNDMLKLPLITEMWTNIVHSDLSKYGYGREFALDFVRHVIENHDNEWQDD